VSRDGQPVHLTPTEYKLLSVLAANLGRVVTAPQLLREVWGPSNRTTGIMCASIWGICGRSWRTIRRSRGIC
jgi:DNA-binding winged helix-turn-helix (wHTH) protein